MSDYVQLKATLAAVLAAVEKEIYRGRTRFPEPDGLSIALLEKIGELVQALLDRVLSRDEHDQRIHEAAIQVAAVAVRISEDFDPMVDEVLRQGRPRTYYRIGSNPKPAGNAGEEDKPMTVRTLITIAYVETLNDEKFCQEGYEKSFPEATAVPDWDYREITPGLPVLSYSQRTRTIRRYDIIKAVAVPMT